ncbi:MAG: ubiquitin-like small modifier protein 1 [Nitriliruptorales bacterium]
MPVVRIPSVLRKHTDGEAQVDVAGATVREAIDDLVARHPALREQLLDSGDVRGFVNVYVEDEDIRYLDGLDTSVPEGGEVAIMPAVAGGCGPPTGSGRSGEQRPPAASRGAGGAG